MPGKEQQEEKRVITRRAFLQQALTLSTALPFCFPERQVLLTGFEPFVGSHYNPTKDVVEAVATGEAIDPLILPVAFQTAAEQVIAYMERQRPALVLSLGLKGDPYITIEQRGRNIMDGWAADNAGYRAQWEPIFPSAPEYVQSSFDAPALAQLLEQAGLPVRLSDNAGTFVCNDLIYRVNHYIWENNLSTPFVFFHIPWTTNYTEEHHGREIPFFHYYQRVPLEEVVAAVRLTITALT